MDGGTVTGTGSSGFRVADAYRFASEHGLETESLEIRSMQVHPGIKKPQVVRKGAFVELLEKRALMDLFASKYWPARSTERGKERRQRYLDLKDQNEALLRGETLEEDMLDEVQGAEDGTSSEAELAAFALEAQLRDFIVANISRITISGRRLHMYRNAEGREGREYPTDVAHWANWLGTWGGQDTPCRRS